MDSWKVGWTERGRLMEARMEGGKWTHGSQNGERCRPMKGRMEGERWTHGS
jgi:hypothetical protein